LGFVIEPTLYRLEVISFRTVTVLFRGYRILGLQF
jgi:hypothetical protein